MWSLDLIYFANPLFILLIIFEDLRFWGNDLCLAVIHLERLHSLPPTLDFSLSLVLILLKLKKSCEVGETVHHIYLSKILNES